MVVEGFLLCGVIDRSAVSGVQQIENTKLVAVLEVIERPPQIPPPFAIEEVRLSRVDEALAACLAEEAYTPVARQKDGFGALASMYCTSESN